MFRSVLWCNISRTVKVGPLDGRAAIPLPIAVYHWSTVTLALSVVGMVVFVLIQRKGYTVPNMVRRLLALLGGKHRPFQTARPIRSDC